MTVATDAQRELRRAQITRDENLRAERYHQIAEAKEAARVTLAQLVRENRAVVFVVAKGFDEMQPRPTPVFEKLLRGPDPKTVQARVAVFLMECEKEEELRRAALQCGIDLDGWKEALDYEA